MAVIGTRPGISKNPGVGGAYLNCPNDRISTNLRWPKGRVWYLSNSAGR